MNFDITNDKYRDVPHHRRVARRVMYLAPARRPPRPALAAAQPSGESIVVGYYHKKGRLRLRVVNRNRVICEYLGSDCSFVF
ncbi:hypothetical protein EVAR_47936_1 [Eumeta japonica]|uniref:Uncharacterized protein n=1 Tax=Eumeta variegata TaxID=151549 RepID=A0A4C1Y5D3_EUMVA|nr:hypothetical protein EVAR_47936_1 [Eumeta japonica]